MLINSFHSKWSDRKLEEEKSHFLTNESHKMNIYIDFMFFFSSNEQMFSDINLDEDIEKQMDTSGSVAFLAGGYYGGTGSNAISCSTTRNVGRNLISVVSTYLFQII